MDNYGEAVNMSSNYHMLAVIVNGKRQGVQFEREEDGGYFSLSQSSGYIGMQFLITWQTKKS